MNRAEWLKERMTGIGATDAAAIANLSPWACPLDVYLSKTGELEPKDPSFKMELGLLLEPALAKLYADQTGRTLIKPPPIVRNPERDWQIASLDYQVKDEARNVELKTTDPLFAEGWGAAGTDEIPEVYLVQVTHQMMVSKVPVTDVGVLIGLREFRIYTVEFDPALAAVLTEIEAEMWDRVQRRDPPPYDWANPRTPELVMALNKPKGGRIVLAADAAALIEQYEELGRQAKGMEEARKAFKARIAEMMGAAGEGLLPDGRLITRKECRRAGFTVEPCTYVDFRIKKAPKPKKEKTHDTVTA